MSNSKKWLIRIWALVVLVAVIVIATSTSGANLPWYVRGALIILFIHTFPGTGAMLRSTYKPDELNTPTMEVLWKIFLVLIIDAAVIAVLVRAFG